MQVVLVMFRPDGQRRSFSVTREVTVIGRREDCDLRIPLGEVSRKHCRLVKDGDALRMEDLGSSNGSFHNGTRVRESELQPGDVLTVGPVSFTVQINGVPADDQLQPASSDAAATFSAVPADYVSQGADGNDRLGEMASVITDVQEQPGAAGHAADDLEALQADDAEAAEEIAELEPVEESTEEAAEEIAELEPVEEATEEVAELEPVEETTDELAELEPVEAEATEEVAELEPVEEPTAESAAPAAEGEELVELESAEPTEDGEVLTELEAVDEVTEVLPAESVHKADGDSETIDEAPIAIEHDEEEDSALSAQEMTHSEDPHTAIDPSQHINEDLVDMDLHDSR